MPKAMASNYGESLCSGTALIALYTGTKKKRKMMYIKYDHMIKTLTNDYFSNREDAEDAAQEIRVKLAGLEGKAPEENEPGWVYVVIDNACKDIYRKAKRSRQQAPILEDEMIDSNDPYEHAAQEEASLLLGLSYENMPPAIRTTCYLRYHLGWGYEEIAAELGIPPGTVGSRLMRAKELLSLGA
jgi:RNA polymerase sigma-70 factor (ECF subfamily)